MAIHNESELETYICEYLERHGWLYSANDAGYDRKNAIFPEESLPVEWAQYTPIDATWYTDRQAARAEVDALLAGLLSGDWPTVGTADERSRREASSIVSAYLSWHLERGLRSLSHVDR